MACLVSFQYRQARRYTLVSYSSREKSGDKASWGLYQVVETYNP